MNENHPYLTKVKCINCGEEWYAFSPYGRKKSEGYEYPKCRNMTGNER